MHQSKRRTKRTISEDDVYVSSGADGIAVGEQVELGAQ